MNSLEKYLENQEVKKVKQLIDKSSKIMNIETKEDFRTLINKIDHNCNLSNEIIEDEYLQDDEMFAEIYDKIADLQEAITNYQQANNYI